MSAKEDKNVSEAFSFVAKEIKQKILSGDQAMFAKSYVKGSKINKETELKPVKGTKSRCC